MAKYAISEKGVNELKKLSKSIITNTESIYEAGVTLKNTISSLGEGLGVYEDEILDLVNHNSATLQTNKDIFKQLSDTVMNKADEIYSLMGFGSTIISSNGFSPYRAAHNNGRPNSLSSNISAPKPINSSNEYLSIVDNLENRGVEYRPIQMATQGRSSEAIISRLSGGDMTEGSCSSLAFAYAGNKAGYDVLDFRDGESRRYFSSRDSIQKISELPDVDSVIERGVNDIVCANNLLSQMQDGKEYYFATGRHAAIVRKNNNGYEFLELQHPSIGNGWYILDNYTLYQRFGCYDSRMFATSNYLIDVDSLSKSTEVQNILGFINTAEIDQRKGVYGNVR